MARILGITIAGDYEASGAVTAAVGDLRAMSLATDQASASVDRLVAQRAKLAMMAQAYKDVAASAAAGSDEQILATNKAIAAQAKLADAVKVTAAETETSSVAMGASIGAMSEGAAGKLGGLVGTIKSLALNLIGLGAAFGGAELFKASVDNAQAYDATLRSLDLVIEKTGGSVDAYRGKIDQLSGSGAKLGYTNTDILAGLRQLTLVTGNATDATTYMGLAENMARGMGISLTTAATAVGKAIDGKTTALQRYGIVIAKGEPVEQALADAQARFAGQALSSTTATQKLSATLSDVEEKIGQDLLPVIDKVATATENWLNKDSNQKKVLDDVTTAVKDGTAAFKDAVTVVKDIDKVTGGFQNTLKDLLALKVVSTIGGWVTALTGSAGLGPSASVAEGEVSTLKGTLATLPTAIGIVIGLSVVNKSNLGQSALNKVGLGFLGKLPLVGAAETQVAGWGVEAGNALNRAMGVGSGASKLTTPSQATLSMTYAEAKMLNPSLTHSEFDLEQQIASGTTSTPKTHKTKVIPTVIPSSFNGGPGGAPAGDTSAAKGKKGSAFKIPVELEDKIRAAQTEFGKDITKQHLDTLVSLLDQEKKLDTAHGKTNPDVSEIAAAEKKYQAAVTKQQVDAAKATVANIEAESVNPAQTLKLAQAAGAPATVILADQQNLLSTYDTEAAQLKSKLAGATAATKATYKAALAKITSAISSTEDSVTSTLQSLASTAQTNLTSLLSTVETAADAALGAQYFQNGLQTPAEAQLAAMNAQDTADSLNATLASAQAQLASDQASGAPSATLATDQTAIDQAQRQIQENELQIEATAQRTAADAAYAKAQFNLNAGIESLSKNVGDGSGVMGQLTTLLGGFGVSLGNLTDAGGNGLLAQLAGDVQSSITAFANLNAYVKNPAGGTTQTGTVTAPASVNQPNVSTGLAGAYFALNPIPKLAGGGDIRSAGLAYLHPGERVQPAGVVASSGGGAGTIVVQVNAPNYVGDHRDLAAAVKTPQVREAIATAVIVASRGGHIRQGDIRP